MTVKETAGGIIFLRKIMRGGANKSFGIEVAKLAGIPAEVTARAKEILRKLEKSDIARGAIETVSDRSTDELDGEIERILREIDFNNITPMQALNILLDLTEKVKKD